MNPPVHERPLRVLAISSGGGHWIQLLRLRPAFEGCRVTYATTDAGYREDVAGEDFVAVPNSHMDRKIALIRTALAVAGILVTRRPEVIVSTGAAPGFFALALGRLTGARTIWIDSVANAEELSLSGRRARNVAQLYLTQWPHLSSSDGPSFLGRVF